MRKPLPVYVWMCLCMCVSCCVAQDWMNAVQQTTSDIDLNDNAINDRLDQAQEIIVEKLLPFREGFHRHVEDTVLAAYSVNKRRISAISAMLKSSHPLVARVDDLTAKVDTLLAELKTWRGMAAEKGGDLDDGDLMMGASVGGVAGCSTLADQTELTLTPVMTSIEGHVHDLHHIDTDHLHKVMHKVNLARAESHFVRLSSDVPEVVFMFKRKFDVEPKVVYGIVGMEACENITEDCWDAREQADDMDTVTTDVLSGKIHVTCDTSSCIVAMADTSTCWSYHSVAVKVTVMVLNDEDESAGENGQTEDGGAPPPPPDAFNLTKT